MHKGVVELDGVISSGKADDPVFIVYDIVVLGEMVLIKCKLECL